MFTYASILTGSDIQYYISFRYTAQRLDIYITYEVIPWISLIPT